jgi:hypothetical protein
MRLIWFILLAVVVCFVMSMYWPTLLGTTVPPGQYPLDVKRPSWPATQSVGLYRPMDDDGPPGFAKDAKVRCGTYKMCPQDLETVSIDI